MLNLCDVALTSEGHEYTAIDNGKEGLQAIKDKKFDVVLLDLAMPNFSGVDVLDAIMKEGIMEKQNIIVFTGSTATEGDYGLLLEKGAKLIIRKPVDIDLLIETIKKMPSEA